MPSVNNILARAGHKHRSWSLRSDYVTFGQVAFPPRCWPCGFSQGAWRGAATVTVKRSPRACFLGAKYGRCEALVRLAKEKIFLLKVICNLFKGEKTNFSVFLVCEWATRYCQSWTARLWSCTTLKFLLRVIPKYHLSYDFKIDISMTDSTKIIGQRWKAMSDEEKKVGF